MAESIAQAVIDRFGDSVSSELLVFLISMLPILELRGGMIAARILGLPFLKAFLFCFVGNMLPVPFILLFIRRIFRWLKRFSFVNKAIEKVEARSVRKAAAVQKYRLWGLLLLVAIPLPGTGGWTGSLIATVLDMDTKKAVAALYIGMAIALCIMTIIYLALGKVLA